MSIEPLVPARSVQALFDPRLSTDDQDGFFWKVAVENDQVVFSPGDGFDDTNEGDGILPILPILPIQPSFQISKGATKVIRFKIITPGWQFKKYSERWRNGSCGPFTWDLGPGAPSSQKLADFSFPPALDVVLSDDFKIAKITVTNAYQHSDPYQYALYLNLEGPTGSLSSHDPTLIEDPFEGNGP